jgi:thiamine pyrophosphate-dependent acetolactate synthase large subunit-like protein
LELITPDTDLYVPPRDSKAWNRFRNGVNSFYEVVTDPAVSMKSIQEQLIVQSDLREEIKYLEYELGEVKPYKERFEALEKAQAPEYEKMMATLKK